MDIPKTIVCLGDSITNNEDQRSYVDFWQELCNQEWGKGITRIIASGVNGETAYEGFSRLQQDVFEQRPDMVTIMYGHNDLSQCVHTTAYLFHLEKIINTCRNHMIGRIWLLTPNQVADPLISPAYSHYLRGLNLLSKSTKTVLVDLWNVFNDSNLSKIYTFPNDFLHPNEVGHKLMAQVLFETLKKKV